MSELKPVVGVLLITTPRFRNLGEGTKNGIYSERKIAEADRILARLSTFSRPVFNGIVYTREDIDTAMRGFENERVDMVFACFLSWSDDFAWIRFLRDMKPVPVLFASIVRDKLGFENSMNEDRFVEFLSAGGLVGTLEASGSATRFERPLMRRVIGTLETVMDTCASFARASALRSRLKKTSFGLLPSLNEVMWSTYVDVYDLFMKVGPEMRFLSVLTLEKEIEALDPEKVDETVNRIASGFPDDGTVDRDKMRASVAASMAVEEMCRKTGVETLVLNDIEQVLMKTIGLRPGFTPCPGTKDIIVVPEGDIGGALAVYFLKQLSGQPVVFIEPFHIDNERDIFAGGHAGPNDYTDPEGKTILSRDERFARSDFKHAGAPFAWHTVSKGEKTMAHVSQCGGSFKLVCSVVDALPCPHHLSGYTHGLFKPRTGCIEFFQRLIDIGVTQHFAITGGDHTGDLENLALVLGFDFHKI